MSFSRRPLAVLAVVAVLAAAGCGSSPDTKSASPQPSIGGPTAPTFTGDPNAPEPSVPSVEEDLTANLGANGAALAEGYLPFTPDAAWGEATQSPLVDELYVLQDFIWELGDSGAIVQGMGMTQEQASYVSGGWTFAEHAAGVEQSLSPEGGTPAEVTSHTINGVTASRIATATTPLIVIWAFDLGDAYYEMTFYEGEGEPLSDTYLAQFEQAARTFRAP